MRLGRALIDTTPLRSWAVFRRLWIGRACSGLGGQMALVAAPLGLAALISGGLLCVAAVVTIARSSPGLRRVSSAAPDTAGKPLTAGPPEVRPT